MLVEVKPLPKVKWHGKKDKEDFTQPKTIEVLYSSNTGRYNTGLTEEEAVEYAKKLGVPDLGDIYNPNEPHPYWSSKAAWTVLPNYSIILDTDKAIEYVKIKNLRASKYVANSMKEWEEGKYPDATHVIFSEEEEVEEKATKADLKQQAYLALSKLSVDDKIGIIQILSEKTVKGRSNSFIAAEIADIIENKTADFLKWIKIGREGVNIRATILEALHKSILTKEGSAIYYMGERIGFDIEQTVDWFKHPDNQRMKAVILEQLSKPK